MTSPHYVGDYLSSGQAAKTLGVSIRTIQLWANNGTLPCLLTPGGHRRFSKATLEELNVKMRDAGNGEASTVQHVEPDAACSWVSVPAKPTSEMLNAALEAGEIAPTGTWWADPGVVYAAMLKAAPAPSIEDRQPYGWLMPAGGNATRFQFNPSCRISMTPQSAWPPDKRIPLYASANSAALRPASLAGAVHALDLDGLAYTIHADGRHTLDLLNNDGSIECVDSNPSAPKGYVALRLKLVEQNASDPEVVMYLTYPKLIAEAGKWPLQRELLGITVTITVTPKG